MKMKLTVAVILSAFILLSACTPSSAEPPPSPSVSSDLEPASAGSDLPDAPSKKLTGGSLIDLKIKIIPSG